MNPNMLSPARTLSVSARLTFPTGTVAELDGGDILNFTIEEGADSALLPGAVLSSEVTLELANDAGQWNYGGSIRGERPLVGATVALFLCADTDALPCGVFIITSVRAQERSGKICLSGSDSIPQELSLPFQDDLVYPATLESLWQHLVGQTRYVWSGSLPNGSAIVDAPPNWNGASLRRAAGWIAQAAGCFVRVDREGNLQILPCLGGEIHALTPEAYMSYTDGCASYGPVEALQVTPAGAEDPLTVSDGDGTGETLSIQGNPLYQSEAPNLNALISGTLAQLKGLHLHKGEFRWRGDPEVRVGSRVALTDTLSNVSEIIVTRQTLRYCDGFSATCSCEIPEDDDAGILRAITPEGGVNAGALVGTIDGGLLATESVTANSIAAQSITTEKIAAGAVSTDRLAADAVTAEKIQAGAITAQKLAAGAVDAQSIAALTAHLYQITSSDVSTDQLYAALGHIVELSVQSLTAGQISADRLAAALAEFVSMHATTGDFDLAAIQNLLANALILEEGVANSMMITNLAVTSANILSATLDKLVIRGEDGKYYHVFVGADGVVSTEETTVSAGEIEAGETQDGRQIVASTANVASLNATTIKASQAIIATIFTESLTAGKITAGDALIASATIPTLYVTSLKAIGNSIDISANGSITSVVSSVSQAQSTANAAQSAASNAQSTANAAQSAASNAQTAADDAQSAANAAQTAADGAQTAADNAQTAAQNAQSTADVAQGNADYAIPHYGDMPPSAPIQAGKVWIDSGVDPIAVRRWIGSDLPVERIYTDTITSESTPVVFIDNYDGHVDVIALEAGCVSPQSGSGDPSPENVRTISGRTEIEIQASTDQDYSAIIGGGSVIPATALYGAEGAEDLVSVGSKGDVLVTHRTSVKALDGTENFNLNSGWVTGAYYVSGALDGLKQLDGFGTIANIMCSHATAKTPASIVSSVDNIGIGIGNGTNASLYLNLGSQYATVADFKAYLAAQYAAGTPVTIVYELAEPVTETLAPITPVGTPKDTIHIAADSTHLHAALTCSGWETVSDTFELEQDVEVMRSTIQQLVDEIALKVAKGDLETYLKLMQEGVYIGKSDSIYRVFIDDAGMHVQQYGEDIAVFAKRTLITPYIRVGPPDSPSGLAISKASDGGMMITNLGVIV